MAEFRGIACQWGISTTSLSNSTTVGTGVVLRPLGQDFEYAIKQDELLGRDGEVLGLASWDRRKTISFNLYPSADTVAHADGAALVRPLDVLTITDSLDTDIGSTFSGKYIVRKASKAKRADGKVVWAVTVEQYATDISATIT